MAEKLEKEKKDSVKMVGAELVKKVDVQKMHINDFADHGRKMFQDSSKSETSDWDK